MRRGSVLGGSSFRASLYALGCFAVVLAATGAALHRLIGATMLAELEEQVIEEVVLFRSILDNQGRDALRRAIEELDRPLVRDQQLIALFGSRGEPVAGPSAIAPDFVGWRTRAVVREGATRPVSYRVTSERWGETSLVVGRSTRLIERVLDALVGYLLLAGTVVTATCVAIGYVLSRDTRDRLGHMADVLDRVGRGDMRARLPVGGRKDQIAYASERINGYLDDLSALMDDMRNTVSAVAHDLRTPLSRASLRLQEAALAVAHDESALTSVEAAGAELDTLGDIFETILRIGRIRASDDRRTFTTFPAGELVTEMAEMYEPVFEAAGQTLRADTAPAGAVTIHGDRRMLRQLLSNLLRNVVAYAPAGTTATLRSGVGEGGGALLVVADDGPGIPAEMTEEVLKPFVRLDASRTRPGSGLGLALVDTIARHHHARLALLDNAPGLSVVVAFPARPSALARG